jgi:hypothetical protein
MRFNLYLYIDSHLCNSVLTKSLSMISRKPKSAKTGEKKSFKEANSDQFPGNGIGFSSSSLESMEQFFKNLPVNSGMAFKIIKHLDTSHVGDIPELLQRVTLPVVVDIIAPVEKLALRLISYLKFRPMRLPKGIYPSNIAANVSAERPYRFFSSEEGGSTVVPSVYEMIVFALQNLTKDPPFTKLDILICLNLLIFIEPESQKQLLSIFQFSLNAGEILLPGSSETIGKNE